MINQMAKKVSPTQPPNPKTPPSNKRNGRTLTRCIQQLIVTATNWDAGRSTKITPPDTSREHNIHTKTSRDPAVPNKSTYPTGRAFASDFSFPKASVVNTKAELNDADSGMIAAPS